jgi:hypothetical protein
MNKNLNWNLDHILPAGEFESFLKKLKKDLPELKKFAGKLEP